MVRISIGHAGLAGSVSSAVCIGLQSEESPIPHPERLPELDIALNTGMRKGEQYRLRWPDVNLEARRITLRKTKNGSVRHIPLNKTALISFEALRRVSDGDEFVFASEKGKAPLQNPRYWWDSVLEKAGIKNFHWHDLRHTFASRCIMAGVDLRTLQQLLGHKTLQMVVRYSHLSQSHELAAVEKICPSHLSSHS